MGIVLFVVAILVVVMIHESGHFITAKLFGFKATKFFVGFGPTVWSFRRGETEYGIKALPLGGFVKIVGMNPYEEVPLEDRPRSYPNKPRWQRAIVLVAGSATHWLIAFVVLAATAMTLGVPTGEQTTEIAAVEQEIRGARTPAADALRPGDRIVGYEGTRTDSWDDIRRFIKDHPEERVEFLIERAGRTRPISIRLGKALFDGAELVAFAPAGRPLRPAGPGEDVGGFLGVSPHPEFSRLGPAAAAGQSASQTWTLTKLSVVGIGDVFGMVFGGELIEALGGEGERAPDEGPLGLVGASRIAGQSVATGRYLEFIGLIVGFTVFVGIMNLLPLPPLDGGHLAVVGWEALTGRTIDMRKLIPIAAAVISFFVVLFLMVLYLDLARPVKVPF